MVENMVKQYVSILIITFTTVFIAYAEDKKFDKELDKYLPNNGEDVVKHFYYDVKFNETTKTPEWVMYRMTEQNLKHNTNRNGKRFVRDPDTRIKEKTPSPNSYKYSGYDRGHMCPADDMEFSDTATQETFYTSNICPQLSALNRGNWKELEEAVRDLNKKGKELIVITGPIYDKGITHETLGADKIQVPNAFFKIIYNVTDNRMIGVIMDNNDEKEKTYNIYIVPVSKIEKRIRIDFFKNLPNEKELESKIGFF